MVAPTNPATSASESASPDLWSGLSVAYLSSVNQWLLSATTPNLGTDASLIADSNGDQVVQWDSTSTDIAVSAPFGFDPAQPWTISTYIEQSTSPGDDTFFATLCASPGVGGNHHIALAHRSRFPAKQLWIASDIPNALSSTMAGGSWALLTLINDGTDLKLYLDNTVAVTAAIDGTWATQLADMDGGNLYLASSAGTHPHSVAKFKQASVVGWGRAISTAEIAQMVSDPYAAFRQTVANTAIQPDEFQDGQIFQRQSGSADVLFTGTTDSDVEVRVVESGTSTTVVDWTPLTVTGTTYSGTLTVPEGGWYHTQVRYVDGQSEADSTVDWGVGIIVGCIGQSNMEHWWQGYWTDTGVADTGAAPNTHVRSYRGGTWSTFEPYGNGAIAYANEVYNNLTDPVPVGLIDRAVGGSALLAADVSADNTHHKGYWLNLAAGDNYDNFITDVASLGGSIEQVIWQQGERDGKSAASQFDYDTGLNTLFGRIRTDCANASASANLPIMVGPIGVSEDVAFVESEWEAIRNAQKQITTTLPDVTLGPNTIDLPIISGQGHHPQDSYTLMGRRYARVSLQMLGESAGYGNPTVSSIDNVSATQSRVNIQHGGGTDFTPTSAIQGFTVSDAGASIAVSDASRETATSIIVTHAAASNDRAVSYEYTDSLDITAPFADNAPVSFDLMFYEPLQAVGSDTPPAAPAIMASESASPDLWTGGMSGGLVYNGQVFDAFHNSAASLVGSPSIVSTAAGDALRLNYGSQKGQTIDAPYVSLDGLSSLSYWVYAKHTDGDSAYSALGIQWDDNQGAKDPNAQRILFGYYKTENSLDFAAQLQGVSETVTWRKPISIGTAPHVIGFDWDGTTVDIYFDGAVVDSFPMSGILDTISNAKHPEIMGGQRTTGTSSKGHTNSPNFDLYAWGMNSSALGAQAHADIAADPYAAFRVASTASSLLLTGSVASNSYLLGALNMQPGLSGSIASTSSTSASLSQLLGLIGRIDSTSSLSGALSLLTEMLLAGQIQASSLTAGTLSLLTGMAGAVTGVSQVQGSAGLEQSLAGQVEGTSNITAALGLIGQMLLTGTIQGSSSLDGNLSLDTALTGDISSVSELFGQAWLDMALSGQIKAASDLESLLSGITIKGGYLTLDRITITPALSAALHIKPN